MKTFSKFIVRVLLHDADNGNIYDLLHKYMKDNNFERTILDDEGNVYDLPNAEYSFELVSSQNDTEKTFNKATQAIEKCIKDSHKKIKYSLMVTKAEKVIFNGLEKSKKEDNRPIARIVLDTMRRIETRER